MAQYHFDFENGSGTGTDLFPGSSWEQVPEGRWKRSGEGAIEGAFSLQHDFDNPESGCDYLIFNHHRIGDCDSLIFSFRIRHGYAPSSSNNWQLALLAEFQTESMQIQNGIVVGVNFTGSDDLIKIWKCEGGSQVELCSTSLSYQEEVGTDKAPLFRLVWYREGRLNLFYAQDPSVGDPVQIASCKLDFLPSGRQFIIRYEYSSARDRNLWVDQVILDGNFVEDRLAPRLMGLEVMGEKDLKLSFSEQIATPPDGAFLLDDSGPEVISTEGAHVMLGFLHPFPNRSPLKLRIGKICDWDQNCMKDTLVGFMRNEAVWGDVVFNELMADPEPSIHLPEEEYLELYNRSDYPLDLGSWRVEVNTRTHRLKDLYFKGSDTSTSLLEMSPGSYAVLKGMVLPNEGASLGLYSGQGTLVHGVSYQVPWDAMEWKKEGGWSLESPDPEQICTISQRWEYSEDLSGGTPGRVNSKDVPEVDHEVPLMLYYGYGEGGELYIQYSEPIELTGREREDFALRPGPISPLELSIREPLLSVLDLRFPEGLRERNQFTIDLPVLSDCKGNTSRKEKLRGGKVVAPAYGALVINEIMYNPLDGFPEYVEVYNPGPGYFDLRDLALHIVESGALPEHPAPLSSYSRIFLPEQFLVLTACIPQLEESYGLDPSGSWVEVEAMPQMKNAGGSVYLTDRAGTPVDRADFSDDLHMEILADARGISLERISYLRTGSDPGNWHSAASISGYATPGKENSQALDQHASHELLEVEPPVFSPDNDGYQDLLKITISTRAQGWVLSLWISDLNGGMVRRLANNHISGPLALYSWDGEMDSGSMVPGGIYMLHLQAYHPVRGERWQRKEAIGVMYR